MSHMAPTTVLASLLKEWLPRQRWFPVKAGLFELDFVGSFALSAPALGTGLEVQLISVAYATADGGRQTDIIQVPLSFRSASSAALATALVGQIGGTSDEDPPVWVYDAPHDPDFVTAWLDLRNKAAHGHYLEYTKEQVELMLQSVRDFTARCPA